MTIEPIGAGAAAVYITPAELEARGLTPETVTAETAAELARQAFVQAGIPARGRMEIEAYPDAFGVLLFARIREPVGRWFSFAGLEELLQGVSTLPHPRPEGMLAQWQGRYWLKVQGGTEAVCRLGEFGERELPPPWFEARLAEQEGVLAPQGAFGVLERYFSV